MTLAIAKTIGDIKMTEYGALVEWYWQRAGSKLGFSANWMQCGKCLDRMRVSFDFRLRPRSRWHLRSFGILRSVQW